MTTTKHVYSINVYFKIKPLILPLLTRCSTKGWEMEMINISRIRVKNYLKGTTETPLQLVRLQPRDDNR